MKKISLLFLSALIVFCLNAQNNVASEVAETPAPTISFEKSTHDFGKIKEADGKATYTFTFTNQGKEPLVINRVQASCGCTTPEWTKEPIAPGKKGTITATYNPTNRPGAFNKAITVHSSGSTDPVRLFIKGDVIPKTN